jgi:hypothetical protein
MPPDRRQDLIDELVLRVVLATLIPTLAVYDAMVPDARDTATVDLYHAMDGRLTVAYQGQDLITFLPAVAGPPRVEHFCPQPSPTTHQSKPAEPVTLPLPKPVRSTPKPAANHPWRKMIQRDVERHRPPEVTAP